MKCFILSAVVAVAWIVPAQADVVKDLATGMNAGAKIANNGADNDFVIDASSVAFGGTIPIARSTPLPPPYIPDSASSSSRWIAISSGSADEGLDVPHGNYYFDTQVNLAGYAPSTAQMTGVRYAADDKMLEIIVNSNVIWTRPVSFGADFYSFTDIGTIGLGAFHSGLNTIQYLVYNDPDNTAMALRIEGQLQAVAVPEPTTCVLAAFGAMALSACAFGQIAGRWR